ncbi:MAG: FtsQ-type POTRA domain-containing protein [Kofleriaceae bacterium]
MRLPSPRAALAAVGRGLRRLLPAIIATAAAGAVIALLGLGYRFVTTSPRFAITAFEFHGNRHRTDAELRAQLPVADGANLFSTHVGRLTEALRRDPWLAEVDIERRLPHTLVVTVREREPAAVLELDGLYLADATGAPFKRLDPTATRREDEGLPIITGLGRAEMSADPTAAAATVRAALAVRTAWLAGATRPELGELHLDPRGGLTLHTLDDAIAVRLGPAAWQGDDADLAARLRQFDLTWSALSPSERARVRTLHLDHDTRPDHVTVALADA